MRRGILPDVGLFSLAYNMTPPSALKWLLRRFDHSMIYVMIAGTYTALIRTCTGPGPGCSEPWSWGGAMLGILVKIVLPGRYDRLSILAYVMLGWVGVIAIGRCPRPCLSCRYGFWWRAA